MSQCCRVILCSMKDLQATWSSSERQHALGKDILLLYPEDQVDSFTLYIKASILLSRVKAFNLRFRAKRFIGDPMYIYSPTYDEAQDVAADPRQTSSNRD